MFESPRARLRELIRATARCGVAVRPRWEFGTSTQGRAWVTNAHFNPNTEETVTDYATRFNARRSLVKKAYTDPNYFAQHRPSENPAVNVMVDTILLCKAAGVTLDGLIEQAEKIADQEWYFAEAAIREAVKS